VPPPGSGSVRASGSRRRTPPGDTEIFDLGGEVKLVLKRIPAKGKTFWMASPETEANREQNEEQHEVEFSHDYYLGEWKVTQAQYQAIAGKWVSWYSKGGGGAKSVDGMDTDDFPVERLDWKKAQDFCDKLTAKFKDRGCTFRLPTEAEWEFACRAGDDRKATLPFYPEVRTQRVVVEWAGEF
jgi:formylglycine-generating enzyme required for sulfatase activity